MAAPTKFTPETVKKLTDAIRLGATYELAAKSAGISYETFNNWKTGKAFPKGTKAADKVQFLHAIEKAEGDAAVQWLAKIEKAANDGAWQAAAWKLERRYPRAYGRTVQEHTGPNDAPLTIQIQRIGREVGE